MLETPTNFYYFSYNNVLVLIVTEHTSFLIIVPMSGPESGSFHRAQVDQANIKVWMKIVIIETSIIG